MKYKDILIQLASMTVPYVYDNTISFLELDRKLYKIVHELIVAMQGLNADYEQFKTDMTNSFNEFTTTINNDFNEFKSDVNNQISTFEENMNTNFDNFKTEIEGSFNNFKTEITGNFNTLEGEFNTLKSYVDNYFSNLNLDEEVQTVIQKMVSDGTLANIINDELLSDINNQITQINQEIEQLQNNGIKSLELSYSVQVRGNIYYNNEITNSENKGTIIYVTINNNSSYSDKNVYIGTDAYTSIPLVDKNGNNVLGKQIQEDMKLILIKDIHNWQVINTLPSEYDTTALEEQIEQNTSNITSLQSQVTTNTSNISANTEALDIVNTQTTIDEDSGLIDVSELKGNTETNIASLSTSEIQLSYNESKNRCAISGIIGLQGNADTYSGKIKINLDNDKLTNGKCIGSATWLSTKGYTGLAKQFYLPITINQNFIEINIVNLPLTNSNTEHIYIPYCEVIYE